MLGLTIVEAYVNALMNRAEVEHLEDGTVGAYVPEVKGVLAYGADVHECAAKLYKELEDWVKVSLSRGYQLPVVDDINLNTEASRILSTYHDGVTPPEGEFYADEQQLFAALRSLGEATSKADQGSS